MAESYKIVDLDIDYNKLVTSTTNAKLRLKEMKDELALLKREGKENTEQFVKLDAEMKVVANEVRVNTKLMTDSIQAGNEQNATIEQMRKALSVVSVQWSQLTEDEMKNTEEGKKLSQTKLELTEKLKELEAATGDNRRNVGNYTQSIIEAAKSNELFGGALKGPIETMINFKDGLIKAKDGFSAASQGGVGFQGTLKGIGGAFAASGIGTIIVAFTTIISILQKYKPVADKVEQVTAAISAVMTEVTNRVGQFAAGFKSFFTGNFSEGFKQMSGSVDGLGKSLGDATSKAMELKKSQQELEDNVALFEMASERAAQKVEELMLKAKNKTLSERERIDLLNQAAKIEKDNYELELKNATESQRIARERLMLATGLTKEQVKEIELNANNTEVLEKYNKQLDKSEEARDAFVKSTTELIEVERKSIQVQETIQNRRDKLDEDRKKKQEEAAAKKAAADAKAAEEEKKRIDKMLEGMQEEIDFFEVKQGKYKEDLTGISEYYVKKLALLDEELKQEKISQTKYDTEKLKLEKETDDMILEIEKKRVEESIRIAEDQLAQYKFFNETRIQDGQLLTEQLIQQELDRLILIKDAAEEIERQKFLSGQISAEEYRQYQIDSETSFLETQNGLYGQFRQQRNDAAAIDLANQFEIMKLNGISMYDEQREQARISMEAELKDAESKGANISMIKEKYSKINARINKMEFDGMAKMAGDAFGQIADMLGKNTAAGKAFAVAQATINTYLGVSQILAAPPSGPEPLNSIIKGVSIASTIATGIANVSKIVSVKAERGGKFGTVGGNLHTQGGTKYYGDDGNVIEMERDENFYVLNRGASRAINSLSALNQHYGGVSFSTPRSGYFADGGMLSRSMNQKGITDDIMDVMVQTMNNIRPVVDVKDIITGVDNRVSLVDGSSI